MLFRSIFAAAISAMLFAAPAPAQDLAPHLGPLAPTVTLGQEGPWTYSEADGWFNMINETDPAAIHYFYITRKPVAEGQERSVRVLTALRGVGDGFTAAGLMFNAEGDLRGGGDKGYFVLAITSTGLVKLLVRSMDGKFDSATAEDIRARLDGSDVLEIRERPGEVELRVNGARAFTMSNDKGFSPSYGILATGLGRMAFTGFAISEE